MTKALKLVLLLPLVYFFFLAQQAEAGSFGAINITVQTPGGTAMSGVTVGFTTPSSIRTGDSYFYWPTTAASDRKTCDSPGGFVRLSNNPDTFYTSRSFVTNSSGQINWDGSTNDGIACSCSKMRVTVTLPSGYVIESVSGGASTFSGGTSPGGTGYADISVSNNTPNGLTFKIAKKPTCSFSPSSYTVSSGNSVALGYSMSNYHPGATGRICSASGSCSAVSVPSTSFTANPTSSTTYTLTVTNYSTVGSCTANVTVNVPTTTTTTTTKPSATCSISGSPTTISAGGSATLTWSTTNATSTSAYSPSGWSGSTATSGSKVVSPSSTTTYSMYAYGAGATGSCSRTITVSAATTTTTTTTTAPTGSDLMVLTFPDYSYSRYTVDGRPGYERSYYGEASGSFDPKTIRAQIDHNTTYNDTVTSIRWYKNTTGSYYNYASYSPGRSGTPVIALGSEASNYSGQQQLGVVNNTGTSDLVVTYYLMAWDSRGNTSYCDPQGPWSVYSSIQITIHPPDPYTITINKNETGNDGSAHTWGFEIYKCTDSTCNSYTTASALYAPTITISAAASSGSVTVDVGAAGYYWIWEPYDTNYWGNATASGEIVNLTASARGGTVTQTNVYPVPLTITKTESGNDGLAHNWSYTLKRCQTSACTTYYTGALDTLSATVSISAAAITGSTAVNMPYVGHYWEVTENNLPSNWSATNPRQIVAFTSAWGKSLSFGNSVGTHQFQILSQTEAGASLSAKVSYSRVTGQNYDTSYSGTDISTSFYLPQTAQYSPMTEMFEANQFASLSGTSYGFKEWRNADTGVLLTTQRSFTTSSTPNTVSRFVAVYSIYHNLDLNILAAASGTPLTSDSSIKFGAGENTKTIDYTAEITHRTSNSSDKLVSLHWKITYGGVEKYNQDYPLNFGAVFGDIQTSIPLTIATPWSYDDSTGQARLEITLRDSNNSKCDSLPSGSSPCTKVFIINFTQSDRVNCKVPANLAVREGEELAIGIGEAKVDYSGSDNPITWQLDFGDGALSSSFSGSSNATPIAHVYQTVGTYELKFVIRGHSGNPIPNALVPDFGTCISAGTVNVKPETSEYGGEVSP